ncbi:major facilitator superfamily domain-containing protein [Bisporella sp. PMI_857]|nr:major facilitator superfamily domain-containing protein [Bisporella sp. PMI_857]
MAQQEIEHHGSVSSDASSESSESLSTYSERVALLPPGFDAENNNYKSTSVVGPEPIPQDQDEFQGTTTKSTFAILSVLLVGVFISHADSSLVFATYATIASEFNSFSDAAWLTTTYTLASCAVQPIVGKLSDIYGRKSVILSSYVIFALGSVLTGVAQAMWQVIVGRVISGLGAAGMVVIVSVLITDLVPLIQIAAWRSYVNVIATLGRSIGGPLGGFLADTVGWRISFTGQGPLMAIAIVLVAIKLPSQTVAQQVTPKGQPSKLRRIDFIGAILLANAIVSFLLALSLGGQNLPWSSRIVIGLAIGSVFLTVLFVWWEVHRALEPIFPPSLVAKRDVATAYAIMALQTGAQVAMMFSIPLYFRVTEGASNTVAGSHLFPAVLGNTVGGLLAGFTIQRTGRYKFLTILATVSSSITYVLLIIRWTGKISVWESLEIIPGGFGSGMAQASTFIALSGAVEKSEMAIATGGIYLSSAVGMLVGLAISSSVQMGTLRTILEERIIGRGSRKIIEKVISDVASIGELDEGIRNVVVQSYVKSLEYSHMVSLGFALTALLVSFTIRERRLK